MKLVTCVADIILANCEDCLLKRSFAVISDIELMYYNFLDKCHFHLFYYRSGLNLKLFDSILLIDCFKDGLHNRDHYFDPN
jgi:hypothetical protein